MVDRALQGGKDGARISSIRRGEKWESRSLPTDDNPMFSAECQAEKQNFDIDIPLTY